ncbi:MAG: acetyl-CoA carboxylase biotin carboxyl carrier protein [Candidatus Omnitrophica bacterium]|nr:acetyl-CoA carboxylase biotin carboxyl carrier protein [Candidatus Omnitrophota bacterium]
MSGGLDVNLKELKELLGLMEEHQLGEIEIEREGLRVRLKKSGGGTETVIQHLSAAPTALPAAAAASAAALPPPKGVTINSPMVGTFYRAPSPESPPFVELGQTIEPGKVICILEAMKLMNELKAEVKGRIVQVLAENGQPVEFGQPLFLIEPL